MSFDLLDLIPVNLGILEKRNKRIEDPEPLKFCRYFDRFAANLQCH